jgi:nitronate monooxygenase
MNKTRALLDLLKIRHPIIQAPMAGVSTPQLAAAVSNAGGLGSLSIGASTLADARAMIVATRKLTSAPFNVNVFCHEAAHRDEAKERAWLERLAPLFSALGSTPPASLKVPYTSFVEDPAILKMLIEERPAVVSFHFGLPDKSAVGALREAGIVTLASATSIDEGARVEAAGFDAIVAQGVEAGGHRGGFDPNQESGLGTFALIALLARHCERPIIAAGGIMNGAGICAALMLGAAAAQLGTAFVLCPESSANQAYRDALQSSRAHDTLLTAAISGRNARGLRNRFHSEIEPDDKSTIPEYPVSYDAAKALIAAAQAKGIFDFSVQWAGQGAPLARAMPAAALIDTLIKEMRAPLNA